MTVHFGKADEEMRQAAARRGGRVRRALTELEEALSDMRVGDIDPKTRRELFGLLDIVENIDRDGIPCL